MQPIASDVAVRNLKRNFALGVLNGAFFQLFNALVSPILVLPLFVRQLTSSNFLVSLIPVTWQGGWFLPQLLISPYIQNRPQKKAVYSLAAVIRVASWGLIVLAVYTLARDLSLLLLIFFVLQAIFSVAGGVGGLPFMDIVGKAIPVTRLGSFFGARNLFGGILAFFGGFVVKYFLDKSGQAFPVNFALLFSLSLVILAFSLFLFTQVVEPHEPVREGREALPQHFRRALELAREDLLYRRFLLMRIALIIGYVATPFYIVYARERLGIPEGLVGFYISAMTLVSVGSNLLWSRISDHRSNKLLLQMISALALTMPLLALFTPNLEGLLSRRALGYLFGMIFVVLGGYESGINIGSDSLLLEISPPTVRPLYIGFTNSLLGVAFLASVLGGVIVEVAGFVTLFSMAFAFYLGALLLSFSLADPRERAHAYRP